MRTKRGASKEAIASELRQLIVNTAVRAQPRDADDFEPFPVDALPDGIAEFVMSASAAIGCDPTYLVLPLLVGFAAAIGNTRNVRLKRTWTEPAVLWGAIVGYSGTCKSPAIRTALKPLFDLEREALVEYRREVALHEEEHGQWKARVADIKKKNPEVVLPPEPAAPTCKRLTISDVTTEALADRLEQNPRGLALIRDELSAWLGSFDRYPRAARRTHRSGSRSTAPAR